ncbi:Bifunctional epoxide hydrolase 2 [Saguinus oedipus]|uniref:Bifunctional epoxide hydrolase 2 n=1 Tax=Saguinus oedipus TaxID=9490 RepID=A0ABQ9U9Z8_SAGOE|nr:Bifunctional epoxide hydrolase 2 [Saguinus oedipus]
MVTEEEIQFYVQQFKKSGFRGPLNWYRNIERNWKWACKSLGRKVRTRFSAVPSAPQEPPAGLPIGVS